MFSFAVASFLLNLCLNCSYLCSWCAPPLEVVLLSTVVDIDPLVLPIVVEIKSVFFGNSILWFDTFDVCESNRWEYDSDSDVSVKEMNAENSSGSDSDVSVKGMKV